MPERRSLRSNKPDTSSSTNGEKTRSNSQSSSSNKDKPNPSRSTSSRSKSFSNKKGITAVAKDTNGDQPRLNGSESIENGVDSITEPDPDDKQPASIGVKKSSKDKDGDEEMTVVVPPPKASKVSGSSGKDDGADIAMNGTDGSENQVIDDTGDPQGKAVESTYS
jgi:hypothetical protein